MPDRPRASSRRRKEARPRELLDAALAVFIEKGFASARPEEIALRAGVSKGTLYLYFHSKEDMLAALIDERFSFRIAVESHASAGHAGASRDLLRSVMTAWCSKLAQGDAGGVFKLVFAEARAFPALAQFWLHEIIEPLRDVISPIVARGIARGEFRTVDPDLVVHSLVLPIVMVCLHRHATGPSARDDPLTDQPDFFTHHLEFVLEGLTPLSHAQGEEHVRNQR
jgi:AcrR family transcriptional regulator